MTTLPRLHVALPVMDELDSINRIVQSIEDQTYLNYTVTICVNQPDAWWGDPDKVNICRTNAETLASLRQVTRFPLDVIDRSSRGAGWHGRNHGVGWARKTVMDHISDNAGPSDVILSLDADTCFSKNYFHYVAESVAQYPEATGLTVPYHHRLPEDTVAARAILRYEIYMRYYVLNLWRIRSPYAFTALGSAMAVPVWAYRKVGGMTPKLSGEDFYFLQKLRKAGSLITFIQEKVYPEARFSSRVFFGTGPAMIRGASGDWSSYPIYASRFFDEIGASYSRFPDMLRRTVDTPVTRFLSVQTGEDDPFAKLRRNFREERRFIRACHEKFDGLRILQYLKQRHQQEQEKDETTFTDWLELFHPAEARNQVIQTGMVPSFTDSHISDLDTLRNFLEKEEMRVREASPLLKECL